MPNVVAALSNTGGPSVQRRKVWLTPTTRVPWSNADKTRNPAVSGPKFTILSGHIEEVLLLNKFFRLSIHALVAKIGPEKVVRWCRDGDFFCVLYLQRAACSA